MTRAETGDGGGGGGRGGDGGGRGSGGGGDGGGRDGGGRRGQRWWRGRMSGGGAGGRGQPWRGRGEWWRPSEGGQREKKVGGEGGCGGRVGVELWGTAPPPTGRTGNDASSVQGTSELSRCNRRVLRIPRHQHTVALGKRSGSIKAVASERRRIFKRHSSVKMFPLEQGKQRGRVEAEGGQEERRSRNPFPPIRSGPVRSSQGPWGGRGNGERRRAVRGLGTKRKRIIECKKVGR